MATWMPHPEHLRTVLAPLGLTLQSAGRPKNGLTGNVFVLLTDQGRLVLKVSRDPSSDWKLTKERLIYNLLRRQGVPAPHLLLTDLSRRRAPFAYTLSDCLPGDTFSHTYPDMDPAARLDLYRQLGDLLGRMHSLTFDCFGDCTEENGRIVAGPAHELASESQSDTLGPFATWRELHREIVRGRLSFLSRTEFQDLVAPITQWFKDADALLDYPITPRLLHMDLHRSNILVSSGKVTGFLDVEESLIGHNEYDLMRTELAHFETGEDPLRQAFLSSYQEHVKLDPGYEKRRPLYDHSRSLVGLQCLVWFGSGTADHAKETTQARAHIRQLLDA